MSNSVTELKLSGKVIGLVDNEDGVTISMGATCPTCIAQGRWNCGYFDECGNHHPALKLHRGEEFVESISLSQGQWSIVGLAKDLTEEQWKGILPQVRGGFAGHIAGYKDYNDNGLSMDKAPLKTATESGLSLLASNGKKPSTTLIIIKNE